MNKLIIYLFLKSRLVKVASVIVLDVFLIISILFALNMCYQEPPITIKESPIVEIAPETDIVIEEGIEISPPPVEDHVFHHQAPESQRDKEAEEYPPLYRITQSYIHIDYKFLDGRLKGEIYREMQAGNKHHYRRSEIDERILNEIHEYKKVREEKVDHHLIIYMSCEPD